MVRKDVYERAAITNSGICQRRKLTSDYAIGHPYPWVLHPKIQPTAD